MTWCLDFLQCILCCEEDDFEDEDGSPLAFLGHIYNTLYSVIASTSEDDADSESFLSQNPVSSSLVRHREGVHFASKREDPVAVSASSVPDRETVHLASRKEDPVAVSASFVPHRETVPLVPRKEDPVAVGLSQNRGTAAHCQAKPSLSTFPPFPPFNQKDKANYILLDSTPTYVIPEEIKHCIKKGIVPAVLNKTLSPLTYTHHFAALLYAEDFYIEKWSKFKLVNVTLKLHEAAIYGKLDKNKRLKEKADKIFVAFEIDSVRERRPFLLSRDFVFVRPSGSKLEPFQGIIYRVVKSTVVLVEFGEDFHSQNHPYRKYDVSFSFNRICLTRAHRAIVAASDPLFLRFLFPDCTPRNHVTEQSLLPFRHQLDWEQKQAVCQILSLNAPPPYLIKGQLSVINSTQLSRTGLVVQESVLQIYHTSQNCRILICAPINHTCDVLIRSLKEEIPESAMFRANAAFREEDKVPNDILPTCLYEGECFACPALHELRRYRVIMSTYVSSFRLHNEGITAGHFSHIFLVDASSAIEPETMVALANLADEKTAVVVSGAPNNYPSWVRSDIARENGLRKSYFERLCESKPYRSLNHQFIRCLKNPS